MRLIFITSFYGMFRYVQQSGYNLFEYEKVFQTIGIVLPTEQNINSFTFIFQSFRLNFKLTFKIFKETMNDLRTPHNGCFC